MILLRRLMGLCIALAFAGFSAFAGGDVHVHHVEMNHELSTSAHAVEASVSSEIHDEIGSSHGTQHVLHAHAPATFTVVDTQPVPAKTRVMRLDMMIAQSSVSPSGLYVPLLEPPRSIL